MNVLAINFLPLKVQNFQFKIYRKQRINNEKRIENRMLSFRLPISLTEPKTEENYWVCFEEEEGFEEFTCQETTNPFLCVNYLLHELYSQCQDKINEGNDFTIQYGVYKKVKFVIDNHAEGNEIVWLTPYFLESKKQFGFLIDFKFEKKKEQIFNRQVQLLSLSLNNQYRPNSSLYFEKFAKLKIFLKKYYSLIFKESNLDFTGFVQFSYNHLKSKEYLFHNNIASSTPTNGLNSLGPNKSVSENVIFYFFRKESEKEKAFKFYNALIGQEFKDDKFYKGFSQTYGVTLDNTNIKGIDSDKYTSPKALGELADHLSQKHENERIIILAFSQKKELVGNEKKKYLNVKYAFAQKEIPVQFILYSTVTNPVSLRSAISNLALAIFSKLGGIPWKVKPENEDCLVIGIGQAYHRKINSITNLVDTKKYIAYSVLLDTSGIYKRLEVLSMAENFNSYLEKLREQLVKVLSEVTDKYKKIAIHVPFKIKRKELDLITKAVNEINSEIEIVVIKINIDNDFWGYDQAKSHLTPNKDIYLSLSDKKYLLWLDGLGKYDNEPKKRYSGPILIDFLYSNKEINNINKPSYIQDILNLSGANWRGLNAKATPVSVYYCKLVSDYIKDFKETLDVDELHNKFKNPWFL